MPGSNERQPSDANRAPASRVGDELQQLADGGADGSDAELEERAIANAEAKGWDQAQTAREGGDASGDRT